MDIDKFKAKCGEGICLRNTLQSKRCLLNSKREQCFLKYNRLKEKNKIQKVDTRWEDLRKKVIERDKDCQFLKCMTLEERATAMKTLEVFPANTLDCCHVFGKGAHPKLKYDIDNIFLGNRAFHTLIDCHIDPVKRNPISGEERDTWMKRIIGEDRYACLISKIIR